jgi:GLPGLI family protein
MKRLFLILMCVGAALSSAAQFLQQGRVVYEKKMNVEKMMGNDSWAQNMKGKIPKYNITETELYFRNGESVYLPVQNDGASNNMMSWITNRMSNEVYRNDTSGLMRNRKTIYGTAYNIEDSVPHLNWKLSNDTRTIAGYECRKAEARLYDSILVVAFYSEKLVGNVGPETIGGLPGIILGLAIPRMYTTWFAKEVQIMTVPNDKVTLNMKGKKTTRSVFEKNVTDVIKDWGDEWRKKAWQLLI